MKILHPSFPTESFKWLSMSWGFTLIVWGILWMEIDIQAFRYGVFLVPISVLTGIGGFFLGFDVFVFALGMGKSITLTDDDIIIGDQQISYIDIRAFRYDESSGKYLLFLYHQKKAITLTRDMYSEFSYIYNTLLSNIYDRLIHDYQQQLQAGCCVNFGKDILLSAQEITINRKKIPLENIKKVRTFTHSENGASQHDLVIETLQAQKYKIPVKELDNLPILLEIMSISCPNLTVGL